MKEHVFFNPFLPNTSSPGDDEEVDGNLLPTALQGEPLVEVRRRVQKLHHVRLGLRWKNGEDEQVVEIKEILKQIQTLSPPPPSLFSTAPGPMFGKLP